MTSASIFKIFKVGVGLPAKVFIDGRFLASLLTTPTVGEGFEEVFNKERAQAGPDSFLNVSIVDIDVYNIG